MEQLANDEDGSWPGAKEGRRLLSEIDGITLMGNSVPFDRCAPDIVRTLGKLHILASTPPEPN